uniref:Uncharacterized protein n=1 Tax=Roseihalotalea indica TaxID=2867963 RepID=A0AA49GK24_9BACT|nr:hypothetical protein K4G66_22640 [Tunicatimonas sp. TK19036]
MQGFNASWIKRLVVALALGTAWAVRGQFGHEHGAAWAGGIGVLTLLILSRRQDWYSRLPSIVALGALGWGVGGMMSYGVVVGYGRGVDWLNVSYGLCMLFVIGGLYGFIGGGLTGLALESSETRKPAWPLLITQMVVGGYLIWGILIYQLEWLMTPPRSELWAGCLGAALALGWFMYRGYFYRSLSVALYSALGAGFGFAFGNFLQVVGSNSNIDFNWWNVMEYSLGFFGGLGMAYAVYAQNWPRSRHPDIKANQLGWIFLIILLPITNLVQRFDSESIKAIAERNVIANAIDFVNFELSLAWGVSLLLIVALTLFFWQRINQQKPWKSEYGWWLLMVYLGWYIALSNLLTGAWWGYGSLRDGLYWINAIVIFVLGNYAIRFAPPPLSAPVNINKGLRLAVTLLLLLLVLSWILVNSHGEMPGSQIRFSV